MFGSIYIGLSGLGAYSRGLQQISNNISNLNSQGFRSSTVSFRDSFGVRSSGVTYTGNNSGTGHGVELADTRINFSQGELRQTDRDLDLAIDGSGMLTLLDGDKTLYTRTGSFEVNDDGYIVMAGTDYRLATLDSSGRPVSLSIDAVRTNPPQATTKVSFINNLSAVAIPAPVYTTDVKVYDASGATRVWKTTFTKVSANEWTVAVKDSVAGDIGTKSLKFIGSVLDPSTSSLIFETGELKITLNFSEITSNAGASDLKSSKVDGYLPGVANSIQINSSGQLELGYTNQQKTQLGAIAIADFRDPQALTQQSGGLFSDDGTAHRELMASSDPRVGDVKSRRLEASNVDLSKEFGDLILIQRGFQASSQIISVTNDMIQQLFGIRGQG